jgi:malto-oligosyltrehalose trehalohydrolase
MNGSGNISSGTVETAHGAVVQPDGSVVFRLWAPSCESVGLELDGAAPLAMSAQGGGWFELASATAGAGTRYRFVLSDDLRVADPASRFQPEDIAGPSEVIDPQAYRWQDTAWRGRPWHEAVLYELHVGSFTPAGTFRAAIERLDHLVSLGVTAIELMPIADFPGTRNWGYDGVLLYAPDSSYGRPEDLKALVDAAHARGIMVLLDVVYNHFGPEGNYLPTIAEVFFTDRHQTPWGAAVNYDGKHSRPVRDFVIQNAIYWIEAFHLDGLRLDAVHAILDESDQHLLQELAETIRDRVRDRPVHLILENEENDADLLTRLEPGRPRWFTAQWNDDVHHVLHVAASGEGSGYYGDYLGDTQKLGRALAEGFAFQGETMEYRGEPRGTPSRHLPPTAFVAFIQNHDQIGNRALGDRIASIAPPQAVRAVASVYLLLPQVPMLFMGEEWGTTRPFPFFCDFHGELAEAVRKGRRAEFSRFPEFQSTEKQAAIPDPQAPETFLSAKLDWDELALAHHAAWLDWYRRILTVRRQSIVPLLRDGIVEAATYRALGDQAVELRWTAGAAILVLQANLADRVCELQSTLSGPVLWQEGECSPGQLGPWAVRWTIEPDRAA